MTRGRNRSARIIVSALVFLDVNAFGQAPARDEPKGADTTAGYVDRLIDPSTLAQIADADETMGYDSLGMPRVIRIEARGAISTQGDLRKEEAAVQLSARFDTPSHGAIAIEGAIRTRPSRQTLFTLSQRGLPLDGGGLPTTALACSIPRR